jgi:hypothetical protein
MDINNVPQDESSTYASMKKALYAKDENGKVQNVASSGWDVEETVTRQALDDLEESTKEAYELVKSGQYSTLYYHMYDARMDLLVLAQSTGFFQWSIKRDFKPEVFKNIKSKRLSVYSDAMGKSEEELKTLPEMNDE